jgi:hypothetical protein
MGACCGSRDDKNIAKRGLYKGTVSANRKTGKFGKKDA